MNKTDSVLGILELLYRRKQRGDDEREATAIEAAQNAHKVGEHGWHVSRSGGVEITMMRDGGALRVVGEQWNLACAWERFVQRDEHGHQLWDWGPMLAQLFHGPMPDEPSAETLAFLESKGRPYEKPVDMSPQCRAFVESLPVADFKRYLDRVGVQWRDSKPQYEPLPERQQEVWDALCGHTLSADEIATKIGTTAPVVRNAVAAIRKTRGTSSIKNTATTGYFRPDAPPSEGQFQSCSVKL